MLNSRFLTAFGFFMSAVLLPGTALAYVGPGAGLSTIGTLLALVAACFLALVGFVWYPVKRLIRRKSPAGRPQAGQDSTRQQ